jgi:tetratricopeptide (TPR) repeat protein
LATTELALRFDGYGYATSFFVPGIVGGKPVLVENAKFGWRFFPPELSRSPVVTTMSLEKPANAYRIFLFGESAALGDPRPAFGAGRYLETLLRERYPGTEFEVVCVAMTAINSHAIVPIARECAHYQGDLWVVYMGNNEYVGPFGPNTVFGPSTLPNAAIKAYLSIQKTRTGQLLVGLSRTLAGSQAPKEGWSGLKMFQQNQIAPGDARRDRVTAHFRDNLEDIVKAGVKSGIPVVLSTMASNLRDCAPFGSLHASALGAADLAAWEKAYQAGTEQAGQGDWAGAARLLEAAGKYSPKYAEQQFQLGQCALGLSNNPAAWDSFIKARDWDALPFRADGSLNQAAGEIAKSYAERGVAFVDSERLLAERSPDGISGAGFFFEHVHLNAEGNYQLARVWADKIQSLLPARITARQKSSTWAEATVCHQRLGLSDWNRYSIVDEISRRLLDAPYTNQLNHLTQLKFLLSQLTEIKARLQPQAATNARAAYEMELQKRPQDHWLHQNYAEFLEAIGELQAAASQWQFVIDQLPHHHVAYFQAGRLLARLRQYDAAKKNLVEALKLRPDLSEANLELGQVYAGQRQWDDALKQYDLVAKQRPNEARVYMRRAEVLAAQTKREEALVCLRKAIELRPAYWEARYYLGVELAMDGKLAEAQKQFEEVVRQRPDHTSARFNLGVALAKQKLIPEAVAQFEETLRRDPGHKQARQYLDALAPSQPLQPLPQREP